jgi:hypothetical protein
LAAAWTAKGGIFVHHRNTKTTLLILQKYGVKVEEKVISPVIVEEK